MQRAAVIKEHIIYSAYFAFFLGTFFWLAWVPAAIASNIVYSLDYYVFYWGRKIAPNIVFMLLLLKANFNTFTKPFLKLTSRTVLAAAIAVFAVFSLNMLRGVATPYYWSYQAILTWSFAFVFFSVFYYRRWRDLGLSMGLSFSAVHFAGFIYELPIYHIMPGYSFLHVTSPLIINSNIVSFIVLLAACRLFGFAWQPSKWFKISLVSFAAFSMVYFFHPYMRARNLELLRIVTLNGWLPRLPALAVMFTFLRDLNIKK